MENKMNIEKCVEIIYTNYRGQTNTRKIIPEKVWYGSTQWHPEKQWLLDAHDVSKDALRNFAVKDIKNWKELEKHK